MNEKQKNGNQSMPQHQYGAKSDSGSQDQIDLIKRAVRDTFHEIKKIEKELMNLQQIRAVLKHDLIDLKEGRLDRIVTRHEIDSATRIHSIFSVVPKVEINARQVSQWYVPYIITFKIDNEPCVDTINNSLAKIHAGGACQLDGGEVKYL